MTATASPRRVALAALVLVAWIGGSVLGAAEPRHASAAPLFQIERAHAEFVPVLDGSEPIFVLVLGSDARPHQEVMAERTDSIHIVAINPSKQKASIVGIPRDSYVSIPGFGTNKINAALSMGGPELVVETVEALTGITFDYWAITGFAGFETMVDEVGGLVVDVPFAMSDEASEAFFDPGVQRLSGAEALGFGRNRHDLPSGDFGRSENQGILLISALTQFNKEFTKDPSRMLAWIASFMRNSESSLPLDQLMDLAFTGTAISPKHVVNAVLPGGTAMINGLSVVQLNTATLDAVSADLRNDGILRPANVPPSPNASLTGGS
ncbi:MAG TPA: LCP family protein [Actinomycetota bacterium]|jgi:LCP family protein required for cell wall assembly